MARQPDSAVLLMDLDLHKPQITRRLGLEVGRGMRSLLDGRSTIQEATMNVSVGGIRFRLLPTERASSRSSDWAGSSAMASILNQVRSDDTIKIAIIDMPPVLAGDDAISLLPQVDCMLMVAAAGLTTTAQIKECANYVKKTPLVRVVLNKAPEAPPVYY
jgi:Mrp family chromosome partitioning ATPase